MKKLALLAVLLAATGLAAAHSESSHDHAPLAGASSEEYAFGRAGDPRNATRTVLITMSDKMRFDPANLALRQGLVPGHLKAGMVGQISVQPK